MKQEIKRIKIEIEKQKTKNKKENHVLYMVGERKAEKKKTITIHHHTPNHMEEDTVTLPKR
jgi:hypothetical protein